MYVQLPMMGPIRSWERAAAAAETTGEFADAFQFFRTVLGEKWKGLKDGYPLATTFYTAFQHGPREWVRLHRLVLQLPAGKQRDTLVRRELGSRSWSSYVAAIMTLELCARFAAHGREVGLIQNTDLVSPDVRIHVVERPVIMELKSLHAPDEAAKWMKFHNRIHNILWSAETDASGLELEFKEAALKHLHEVGARLVDVRTQRITEFQALPHGAGRARFRPEWEEKKWGTYLDPSQRQHIDLVRLVAKLAGWLKQLEHVDDGPTVLLVRSDHLFTWREVWSHEGFLGSAGLILEGIGTRSWPSAILAYEEPAKAPGPSWSIVDDGFRFTTGISTPGHPRSGILVSNPNARFPLTPAEEEALLGPKMLW